MERRLAFVDIDVPAAAVRDSSLKLPVVSSSYGGAYIFGGRDFGGDVLPLYADTDSLQEPVSCVIFVPSTTEVIKYELLSPADLDAHHQYIHPAARRIRLLRLYNHGK